MAAGAALGARPCCALRGRKKQVQSGAKRPTSTTGNGHEAQPERRTIVVGSRGAASDWSGRAQRPMGDERCPKDHRLFGTCAITLLYGLIKRCTPTTFGYDTTVSHVLLKK
ncbi:hypothetical protein NDU88_002218 [Pleurodeles waltl]|uniref:Uncharacterized protein n=1 Tax=Pleurodeles waltl TaxID=8319 RepID=A0AAV7SCL7_PLEWA|nr:hypothetical protein NDU88_002218 [Pleurodeles waltl]